MKAVAGAVLALLVLGSALAVVYAKHESRKLFVKLQNLEAERDDMDVEWGQLQLEQSTLTTHGRVEKDAGERMHMSIPAANAVVILRQ